MEIHVYVGLLFWVPKSQYTCQMHIHKYLKTQVEKMPTGLVHETKSIPGTCTDVVVLVGTQGNSTGYWPEILCKHLIDLDVHVQLSQVFSCLHSVMNFM